MFKDQIALGAALLDKVCGQEKVNAIDLEKLDLAHTGCCVLGQLFNIQSNTEYWDKLEELFPDQNEIQASYAHGFSFLGNKENDLDQLTQEWKTFISDRRGQS